jgi:carbamoyl-phosphate synthase large subunit
MRSTGEVMGIDTSVGMAFAKSQLAAGDRMPTEGTVFFSLADRDKIVGARAAKRFVSLGFRIVATSGTAAYLAEQGVAVDQVVAKLSSDRTDANDGEVDGVELISSGGVDLVVNSPRGRGPRADGAHIRRAAAAHLVPLLTTASAALAAANGIGDWAQSDLQVRSLQEFHAGVWVTEDSASDSYQKMNPVELR